RLRARLHRRAGARLQAQRRALPLSHRAIGRCSRRDPACRAVAIYRPRRRQAARPAHRLDQSSRRRPRSESARARYDLLRYRSPSPAHRGRWHLGADAVVVFHDLDEIAVGIAEVDGDHRPEGAEARHRPDLDGNPASGEMADDPGNGLLGDEAEISRADGRQRRLRLELVAGDVQIDLLAPEGYGGRSHSFVGRHDTGADDARIEIECCLEIAHRQDEMIDAIDDDAAHSAATAAAASPVRVSSRGRNAPAATTIAASAPSTAKSQTKSPVRSKMNATSGTPSAATPSDSTNFAPNAVARQRPG